MNSHFKVYSLLFTSRHTWVHQIVFQYSRLDIHVCLLPLGNPAMDDTAEIYSLLNGIYILDFFKSWPSYCLPSLAISLSQYHHPHCLSCRFH